MKLGMFLMPLHDPKAPLAPLLAEDRECVIEIDRLGYEEVFVGEHLSATSEPIADPLQFLATLIPVTKNIRLGSGVYNLPQHHPLQVAASAAQFDNLSGGRFIFGVGPGGLGSDMEIFGVLNADRNAMMTESVDMVLKLWSGDPPWDIRGKYWSVVLNKVINMELGLGCVIRPLQKPHPEIVTTAMSRESGLAGLAGARGWGLISANFIPYQNAGRHWAAYRAGAEQAGLRPDWRKWRLSRSIFVADSDAEAAAYLERPGNSLRWYYDFFCKNLGKARRLTILKTSDDVPDSAITLEHMLKEVLIAGGPRTVLDRLVHIVEAVGPFGGLLQAKKDWDDAALHRKSHRLLAQEVAPRLAQFIDQKAKSLS
jgi:alkanesulfonate monooxygenase SsuD/methylene tetrahydromethanopterin reductase-like flavin-dependent oxidoreductase (luciferase family)